MLLTSGRRCRHCWNILYIYTQTIISTPTEAQRELTLARWHRSNVWPSHVPAGLIKQSSDSVWAVMNVEYRSQSYNLSCNYRCCENVGSTTAPHWLWSGLLPSQTVHQQRSRALNSTWAFQLAHTSLKQIISNSHNLKINVTIWDTWKNR